MAMQASIRTNTQSLARDAREVKRAGDAIRAARRRTRLEEPRGSLAGGGGRGGFEGGLTDLLTRDEFVGRSGTIFRAGAAGNFLGAYLAFQSVEELFRNVTNFIQGSRTFLEVVEEQIKFFVPSIFREQIPALLNELNRREQLSLKAQQEAAFEQSRISYRLENDPEFRRDFNKWRSMRYKQSEEYNRLIASGQSRGELD